MTKFSENELLNREHSFHNGIVVIVHLLFVGVAMFFLGYALNCLNYGSWSVCSLLRIAIAIAVFGYYYHSVHACTGIFNALDLWEQSLLRRRSEFTRGTE
jgi:hypothetical protein